MIPVVRTAAVVFLLFAAGTQAEAQATPLQTVENAFAALSRRDWPTLAALVHPAALASLRQASLGLIILMTENRLSGKEGGGYNPSQVVIADHMPKVGRERVPQFPGAPTIAHLAALSPVEFFVAWCATVLRPEAGGYPVREVVGLQRSIIGEVREGDSVAHVLYRRESRSIVMGELFIYLPGPVERMPLKRVGDGWLLQLNNDLGWSVSLMEALKPDRRFPTRSMKRTTRIAPPSDSIAAPLPPPREQPVDAVRAALAAFERRDWRQLSAAVHPDRLASFQREEIAYLVAWTRSQEERADAARSGISVFVMSYDDSLTPEAVAEVADVKIPLFRDGSTIGSLAALSPADFFARWCEATYGPDSIYAAGDMASPPREVIGQVIESETRAHVLYRSGPASSNGYVELMSVKRFGDGWALLLNEDIGEPTLFALLLDQKAR